MAADIEAVKSIVTAGMKIMYSAQGRKMLISGVQGNKTVAQKLALEVVGLMRIMYDKSKGTMPPSAIPAATTFLIYEVADFMKQAGVKVVIDDIKNGIIAAMKLLTMAFSKEISGGKAKPQGAPPVAPQGRPAPAQPMSGGLINQAMGA